MVNLFYASVWIVFLSLPAICRVLFFMAVPKRVFMPHAATYDIISLKL